MNTTPNMPDAELGIMRAVWFSAEAATWFRESGIPASVFTTKRGRILAAYAMYDRTGAQPPDVIEALAHHTEGEMSIGAYLAGYEAMTDEWANRDVRRYTAELAGRWMRQRATDFCTEFEHGGQRRSDAVSKMARLLADLGDHL